MNKVLVFGITDIAGGVESVIMNYYRNMDRMKVQFDFLCNSEKVAYEEEIKKLGGTIYKVTARSRNRKKYKEEMKTFFKEHANEYNTIWVNVCSLANIDYLKYAKKYGIKYRIIHSHNSQNMDSKLRNILHKINRLMIENYATDFWTCSEDASKWFYNNKIRKNKKIITINNAIDSKKYSFNEETRKQYRKKLELEDKLVIGNIGRLHFQKNQLFLLDIFSEIKNIRNDVVLLIVGEGEDKQKIEDKIKQLNLSNNVMMLGARNDVEKLLQCMDIFIFPSLFEGLSLALIEAQASGICIYASESAVPERAIITENIKCIGLDKSKEYWAQEIVKTKLNNRQEQMEKILKQIREKGYDIATETEKIKDYFERK